MAKEKQPLMVDLEQGIQLTRFTDNEPPKLLDQTNLENETGTGNVGRWSEGFRHRYARQHGTVQEASVWATTKPTKPDSLYEYDIPGLWPSSLSNEYCCIYRVPNRLRRVNPEAYTPQMLLIGPLHHSKKAEALKLSKIDSRYLDYMNMELHKKKYLNGIVKIYGDHIVEEFRKIIKRDEKIIRESYAESTEWIKSQEFVEMILRDSVFILGFFIQIGTPQKMNKMGDIIFDQPFLITAIFEDLILLENQLPYVLLEELFELLLLNQKNMETHETFRDIILGTFGFERKINKEVKFRHFTDLFRCVYVETLSMTGEQSHRAQKLPWSRKIFHNAEKLDNAGVDFVNVDEENKFSLVINFKGGILKMPCFTADHNTERFIRNLMALEQCHYPFSAYICDYIAFLDFLINTDDDVALLVKKGVVENWLGHQGLVTEMVNQLCLGLADYGTYYDPIVEKLNKHYKSRLNRSVAMLRRVYFKNLWTGTATVAAIFILLLTLIGTVASVLQVS